MPILKNLADKQGNAQDELKNTQDNAQDELKNTQDNTQDIILTDKEERILAVCAEPKSRQEIVDLLGYKSIKSIRAEMERLMNANRLTMTIPDKPKSKNQKYIVMKRPNG